MSKSQQRNQSAYSAGRAFRLLLTKLKTPTLKILSAKNKEAKNINKFVRPFWLKGFENKLESGKARKRRIKRSLALKNRVVKSSY